MFDTIEGFEWNEGNREKCQKHGVSIDEIESLFAGEVHVFPDVRHSEQETRFLAIGRTQAGRHVFLAFTLREGRAGKLIRPISARYMHATEVMHYEAQIASSPK